MGRAIDMENDIYALKSRIEKLENTVRGMVSELDGLNEKSSKTIKVDLVEDVGAEIEDKKEDKNDKEKTNNEGNGKGGKQSNNKSRKSSKKNV